MTHPTAIYRYVFTDDREPACIAFVYLSGYDIRSSRDISTSGLGGHIATSGCRSMSQSFMATFFELVIIENLWGLYTRA